jgi:asparaginyl-tRNA synthetase
MIVSKCGRRMWATSKQIPILDLIRLREAVIAGFGDYYHDQAVVEVRPPLLVDVTGACENVDTLLAVSGSRKVDERSGSAERVQQVPRGYLSQTGQLALETALAHCNACWCRTVSFRDDEPSPRHLREFELIEEELGAAKDGAEDAVSLFDELLERIERVLRAGMASALDTGAAAAVGAGTDHLTAALEAPFPRVSYDDAIEIASAARIERGEPLLRWGQDLTPDDETAIVRRCSEADVLLPTIVTCFPIEIKFFNMKCDPRNPKCVLSADVLMPSAGEAVGAAVREDDYERLVDRLVSSSMFRTLQARGIGALEVFEPYLSLIRSNATPRHAGYGIGLERVLQFIAGSSDIRETSLAYRLGEGG